MSFSAFAEIIYGEKPKSFVLQCPSKYKIDDDTAKFFYQYNAKAEVLFITGYSTRLGFFRRFKQMADLSLVLVKTLDFGFASQPDITIYRETLKIESPFNDGEAQCELVSFEYFLEVDDAYKKRAEIEQKEREKKAKEQQKKNKI